MLTGGKLADFLGRRLIFMVGLAVFTGASLACGLAPNGGFLIGARVVQGSRRRADEPGHAVDHHGDLPAPRARQGDRHLGRRLGHGARDRPARRRPPDRARQLELDLLHQRPDRHRRPARDSALHRRVARHLAEQRLDLPGLVTSAVGLFALTYAFIEANNYGWTSPGSSARSPSPPSRSSRSCCSSGTSALPMLDLSLFRNRTFSGANAAMLFVGLAMFGTFFYVSLYMQNVLGYSPVQAGASFLPMTLPDHPDRAARREALRPGRLALARRRRHDAARGDALLLLAARRQRELLGAPARPADRRRRHGADDDADDGGGDERGARRQGRRRLRRAQLERARSAARSGSP